MEPSHQIITVSQLVNLTYQQMEKLNYSRGSLKQYAYSFKLFTRYASNNEIEYYTEKLALSFLEECCKIFSKSSKNSYTCQERKRAVAKLDEMYKYNFISSKKLLSRKVYVFKGCLKKSIDLYIAYKVESLSSARMKSIKLYLERFSEFISKISDIKTENDLAINHVILFIESCSIYSHLTLYATVTCIRQYIQFLENNFLLRDNISHYIPKIPKKRNRTFPKAFTKDESLALLNSIGNNTSKERRDYAMILLAARLGLRASDIANLQLSNINWEHNQINLVQQKNNTPLVLPLLKDVGEAIINYIKNGRPKVDNQYIFLRENAPYSQINASALHMIVDGYLKRAKIKIPAGKKHGPHALRHSIATLLLENNIPISTIKEILSHKSSETTKIYLKIAQKQLLECALEVPKLEKNYTPCVGGVHV